MLKSIKRMRDYALEHGSIGNKSIQGFADEIDYEVSGWYMPLPIGADDEPISVGDVVLDYDTKRSVVAVTPNAIVMDGYEDGDSIRIGYAVNHPHVKPRTVEDVLREYGDAVDRLGQANVDVTTYAAELQMRGDER